MDEFISYAFSIASLVALWFIFKKMGREGWEAIIPFYNIYVLFEELYGKGIKMLFLLIPLYNIYVAIKMEIDLGRAFGKSGAFLWGLVLVAPVFLCILAFSDAQFTKPQIA